MNVVADAGNAVMVSSDMTDTIEDMEGKVVDMHFKCITFHLSPLKLHEIRFFGTNSKINE